MSSIQGRICFKLSVFVYILLIFPSFLVWTIMGTLWVINDCDNELCKDEVGYFWILYLFQVVSYLLIVILFCYLGHEISHYYRMRRIRTRIEDILNNIDVLLASNAMTHSLEDPFFGNNDLGLSIKERAYLKEELLVDIESLGVCSICLEEFKKADFAIVLPGCKHVFHSVCVKEWLERKGFCPNCKGDVRKEIEKAVFSE